MAALLSVLKATQLKLVNRAMGYTVSGTKPLLIGQLRDMSFRKARSLLSIDMGVKNLAYCVVSPPERLSSSVDGRTYQLDAWRRETLEVPSGPTSFAMMARDMAITLLQKYPSVDTILIERQRWRSGGGPAVQQHTIHCNIFESMLHACFLCLMDSRSQVVQSVDPAKVAHFHGTAGKKEKERLLKAMLECGEILVEGDTKMWNMPSRDMKKDDLADCLLQAVTWVQWQENRRRFIEDDRLPDEVHSETLATKAIKKKP